MDGDRMVYPNAFIHVEKRELDFWMNPENAAKALPHHRRLFRDALAKVKPYADAGKVKTFEGATELFPDIRAIPSPGHTPGHSFYALESEGQTLQFWGRHPARRRGAISQPNSGNRFR